MLDDFDDDGASMDPTSSVCEESNSKAVFDTALKLDSSHTEEVDAVEACRRHGGQRARDNEEEKKRRVRRRRRIHDDD